MFSLFARQKRTPAAPSQPLFDDDFQRKLETLAIVSRRVAAGRQRAERRSKKRGSGIEFAEHRNYVEGDDIRHVDWAIYRRFGRLLVRLYEEEEDLSIHFLLDTSASMGFDDSHKFDYARRLTAALAYVGLSNLDRVTLTALGAQRDIRLSATRGKNHIFKIFRFLEELKPQGNTDLRESLRRFVALKHRPGLAVLLSDLYDSRRFDEGLNVLRFSRFEPYVLHVHAPEEYDIDARGDARILDCETHMGLDVTITPALLEAVRKDSTAYNHAIERFCAAKNVPYLYANASHSIDDTVLRIFRQGGFLR